MEMRKGYRVFTMIRIPPRRVKVLIAANRDKTSPDRWADLREKTLISPPDARLQPAQKGVYVSR
jgi:hypothetical protein